MADPFAALERLVTCLCESLETQGAGPTCWCGIWPGDNVSWEFCGECRGGTCGMGYVKVDSVFPTTTGPERAGGGTCHTPLSATIQVGALRCLPVPASGEIPSPDVMAQVAADQFADMLAMRYAVSCCGVDMEVLNAYQALGPQGACVGGEWTFVMPVVE
jgi:hypothetical protein